MNHHEQKLIRDRIAREWNAAPTVEAAMLKLGMNRKRLFGRIYDLRNLWGYKVKFFPLKTQHYDNIVVEKEITVDPGDQLIGGVRLNGELWTLGEVNEIHEWLYPGEAHGATWRDYPKHFRWLLAHNRKQRWFRIMDEEISNRRGHDTVKCGQGK